MNLSFRFGGKAPQPARKRRRTNPWLRDAMKEESSRKLVEDQILNNPRIQAAIVRQLTGLDIDPSQIRIETPEETLEWVITDQAIKKLRTDRDFLETAIQNLKDRVLEGIDPGFVEGGGQGGGRAGTPDEGRARPPYPDPLLMIERVEQIKARLGSGGEVEAFLKSPLLSELVKTLILLLQGRGNAQAEGAARPTMIGVEVDGELVEMTLEAYEAYKQQRQRLANLAAKSGSKPEISAPGDAGLDAPAVTSSEGTPNSPAPEGAPSESKSGVSAASTPAPARPEASAETNPGALSPTLRVGIVLLAKEAFADIETKTPPEYAGKFNDQAAQGNALAQTILAFLGSGVTYENIVKKAQSYKQYDDLRPYVEKLEHKKEYVVALINAVNSAGPVSGKSSA